VLIQLFSSTKSPNCCFFWLENAKGR